MGKNAKLINIKGLDSLNKAIKMMYKKTYSQLRIQNCKC